MLGIGLVQAFFSLIPLANLLPCKRNNQIMPTKQDCWFRSSAVLKEKLGTS